MPLALGTYRPTSTRTYDPTHSRRHSLLTHCFSIEIAFPSSSASFAAPDPLSWQSALSSSPNLPSFRNALRDLTSRGQIAAELDYQCLWILLHGLISVSWTLLWRDLGDLSMVHESKITSWKESLRQGFGVWESHTEALRLRRHTQDCQAGSNKDEDDQLYWAGRPFSRLGCVLLLTDTEQIRIFAGASSKSKECPIVASWSDHLRRHRSTNITWRVDGCQHLRHKLGEVPRFRLCVPGQYAA